MDGLEYVIGLKDNISGPAKASMDALKHLQSEMQGLRKASESLDKIKMKGVENQERLKAMAFEEKIMGKMKASAEANKKAVSGANMQIANSHKQAAAEAQGSLASSEALAAGIGEVASASLAASAAVLGFVGALAYLSYQAGKIAVEAAEFKGDTVDALELLTGSADKAKETYDYLDKLSNDLPLPRRKVFELGQELALAGVDQQDRLEKSIENIANLGQLPGGQGDKLKGLIEKSMAGGTFEVSKKSLVGTGAKIDDLTAALSKKLGKSAAVIKEQLKNGTISAGDGIDALNEVIEGKLGGIAKKQLLDIGVQVQKLKDWFYKLFEDVDIEPFQKALKEFLSMFTEGTAESNVFKGAIVGGLNAMFKAAAFVFPYIKSGFQSIMIFALKAAIFLQPLIRKFALWYKETIGMEGTIRILLDIGKALLFIVAAIAVVVAPFVAMAAFMGGAITAVMVLIGEATDSLFSFGEGVFGFFGRMRNIASDFIDGLVQGIKDGVGKVTGAVTGVAGSMVDSVTDFLDIRSPSKVGDWIGQMFTDGIVIGTETPDVAAPMAQVAGTLAGGAVQGGKDAMAGGGNGGNVDVGGMQLHISGVSNAEQLVQILPGVLASTFEQIAIQFGGSIDPQGAQ